MGRGTGIMVIALIVASCGGETVGTTTTQAALPSTSTTRGPTSTTTIATTTSSAPETSTTSAADPLSCGPEETAIVAGAESSLHLLTPGLGEPVCARSAIDPTWATLRWLDSPDGDDSLLLHLDDGGWVVIEAPPSFEDTDRRYFYFFGCETPPELILELGVC